MKQLKYLLVKEFLQIRRDTFMLRLIILMPIIQLALLPWAATFEQKNISLSIIDYDKSTCSRNLIEKITSTGYFQLLDYTSSYEKGLEDLSSNEADILLQIPYHFENDLVNNRTTTMMSTVNAVNGQKAGIGFSYLTQIITAYNLQLSSNQQGIIVKPYYKYNRTMGYHPYMVPGILVILMTTIGGMLSAMNIVKEKEKGTMEQMNVTPVSKTVFILSKLIPFWIIGILLLTLGMIISWLIYDIVPLGNILDIYAYALIYLMAFTGFGLMISNFSSTQQQAMFIIFFFLIVFILLGGLFTPIESMPSWAQMIAAFNPMTYFIDTIRLIYLKGSGIMDLQKQILRMLGFTLVFNILAVLTYRKTVE